MARFECRKCGSLVLTEQGAQSATCQVCGERQRIPEVLIEDKQLTTRNDYDVQRNHYDRLVYKARKYRDIKMLTETAEEFDQLGDYEDSREMAEYCRKRIAEEQVKRCAEAKTQSIDDQRNEKGRKKYHLKTALINAAVVAILIVITLITNLILKNPQYELAQSFMSDGMYEDAIRILGRLGDFKDSEELLDECKNTLSELTYTEAVSYMDNGHYAFAQIQFEELNGYKDSDAMIRECRYQQALQYTELKNYKRALEEFEAIGDYKDAVEQAELIRSKLALP